MTNLTFSEVAGIFIATFKRKSFQEQETTPSEVPKKVTVGKTVEKTVEKILKLLKESPKITTKELMAELKLTRRGVEWNLKKLKQKRLIRRIGPDKGEKWRVTER